MSEIKGKRIYELKDDWSDLLPGCYYKLPNGDWAIRPPDPNSLFGTLSPKVHQITEHEDGTITVQPSILMKPWPDGTRGWHGYLIKGVWRSV